MCGAGGSRRESASRAPRDERLGMRRAPGGSSQRHSPGKRAPGSRALDSSRLFLRGGNFRRASSSPPLPGFRSSASNSLPRRVFVRVGARWPSGSLSRSLGRPRPRWRPVVELCGRRKARLDRGTEKISSGDDRFFLPVSSSLCPGSFNSTSSTLVKKSPVYFERLLLFGA